MSKPIRGRFYAVKWKSSPRLKVWGRRSHRWQWHAEVWQGRTLLWSDDCRDPKQLISSLTETLAAFRRLAELGQRFESWRDICDKAGKNL